uniref:Uncharacterized protein n=1 Tax=Rhizophora mucronata TaxID=61149 RepID=A0A2P2PN11_RHIMU
MMVIYNIVFVLAKGMVNCMIFNFMNLLTGKGMGNILGPLKVLE